MPNYSRKIVYLSEAQKAELFTNHTITVNGTTITYNENDLYVTPQEQPYIKPSNGIPASDLAAGVVNVNDVQINSSSIVSNGTATIPIGSNTTFGVFKRGSGLYDTNGTLGVNTSTSENIKAGIAGSFSSTAHQHEATFYGLAKVAGHDEKNSTELLGTYTDGAKAAIQNMLGITDLLSTEESHTATAAHTLNSTFMMDGKLHRATAAIAIGDAVEVGTNCEVVKADEVFVKKTDYASTDTFGVVKIGNGLGINSSNGKLQVNSSSSGNVKIGTNGYAPIVPGHQHESVFYGLSKVAGVDLANETVTLGTYPNTSKVAIRKMIDALGVNNISSGFSVNADAETGDWILSANVQDVQINGTSIVNNGVANVPVASSDVFGVVKIGSNMQISSNGVINFRSVGASEVKAGTTYQRALTPERQHASVFYGLAKAAGADMASSDNAVGTYTDAAKVAIRSMLGATSSNVIAVQDEQPTDTDTKIWLPETEDAGIQVPTMADMANYVQKTDLATGTTVGIVKANNFGIKVNNTGELFISKAVIESEVKPGVSNYLPIVPSNQHAAVFYGLAKVAGADLASETVTVGTYPATASAAIRSMLGAISNTDYATQDTAGVVKVNTYGAYGVRISAEINGDLRIMKADSADIKSGTPQYRPIVPYLQHESVFYGLAKAAGDTTQSASSNAVGTYTDEAKAAIHTMLGIDPASIAAQVDIPLVETVSGTTPTITGQPNVRYVCGEVSTISITPPASGGVDVIFESGSTATTMTVPSTVKWPAWFDAEALEANTTYEVLITDGIYGSVMTWAT